jgi:hypothetical protein
MTAVGSARRGFPGADPHGIRRGARAWAAVGVTVALGVGLGGCAQSAALGLVRQACHHVSLSITLYRASERQADPTVAARERVQAQAQLQSAAPLATVAAGEASQWQALMATLSENSRLPEATLIGALQAQCAVAENGGSLVPQSAPTTLPPPPGTQPPG